MNSRHFTVRALDDQGRDHNSERLGSLHVEDQLDPRRLHDREVGGLFSLENSASVDAREAIAIRETAAIGH
jgi:hypothetical protein